MRLIIASILAVSLFSCKEEEKEPDYLMSEEEFIEVLTDFQEAEAIVRLGYGRWPDSLIANDSLFSSVFRKYEMTKVEFDSNFDYYSDRPEVFEKMFEEVITNLSERSARVMESKKTLSVDSLKKED